MAGYICPECGTDLAVKNEDIEAHAASHWGERKDFEMSKEGVERRNAMLAEAKKRVK